MGELDSQDDVLRELLQEQAVPPNLSTKVVPSDQPIETKPKAPKTPGVYRAVRAVGILKPQFQPQAKERFFADRLEVVGTAFWLKDYRVLITCAHVVNGLVGAPIEVTGLLVVGNTGNYRRAVISAIDVIHDLAILNLVDESGGAVEQEAAEGLSLVSEYPTVGTEVGYAGFPMGTYLMDSTHAPTYAVGVIGAQLRQEPNRKEVQITGSVAGGLRGGPVVLRSTPEKVIGVLAHSPSREAKEFFRAISWEHVRALAELAIS